MDGGFQRCRKQHCYYERVWRLIPVLLIVCVVDASLNTAVRDATRRIVTRSRRVLNLSSLAASPTKRAAPWERLACQPVFSVTTPWGSPYLIYERLEPNESRVLTDEASSAGASPPAAGGKGEKTRQVALYFLDETDAIALRDEMLQMDQMAGADMRLLSSSLQRAVRQASNLDKGLLTGQPIDFLTGRAPQDGGSLRYKIVPSKRELFYAARCIGRERVGLFGTSPEVDAELMAQPNNFVSAYLFKRRMAVTERKHRKNPQKDKDDNELNNNNKSMTNALRKEYAHMEGHVAVPLFHCPGLKRWNWFKHGLLRGDREGETLLFFSYDDLVEAWTAFCTAKSNSSSSSLNVHPPNVEVYNMMDVVTSMDKDLWRMKHANSNVLPYYWKNEMLGLLEKIPNVKTWVDRANPNVPRSKEQQKTRKSGLQSIMFVPSSKNVAYKEFISNGGNGKARLRPMKVWGRDAM